MADYREQSTDAAVKLANIGATAADPALVVSLSPNSALPQPDVNATGTITTTDIVVAAPAGTGVLVSGASTAGSVVFSAITGGYTAWDAQVTGLTAGTLYFEGSLDSTTGADGNWINLIGRQTGILNTIVTGNATSNGVWRGNLSGYKYFRVRSVGTLTGTPAIVIRISAGLATVFINGSIPTGTNSIGTVNMAASPTTYASAVSGLVPAALATDVFTLNGSATKTIRISKLSVNGVQTTAGQVAISIVKRSTANAGGTSTAQIRIPYDSASAAATGTVLAYTANPTTLGTVVGTITASRLFVPGVASATDAQGFSMVAGDVGQQFVTLRGVAENLAVNLNGVTITGGAVNVTIEWTES